MILAYIQNVMIASSLPISRFGRIICVLCISVLLAACGGSEVPQTTPGPFAEFVKDIELSNQSDPIAIVETDVGTFGIELFNVQMPTSVAHFVKNVSEQRYENSLVYNVASGFAAYMGDKSGALKEPGDVTPLSLETHPDIKHDAAGIVGFVHETGSRCTTAPNPEECAKSALNSAKTFFYVTLNAQPSLDNVYAPFGRVAKGLEIVRNLKKGNKITKITVVQRQ
ncbi:MAG: hypothetical protein A2V81_05360 [Candidatus Abawacabacteria bacterium RBG_16_42_10]|uniref:peptidylprolyl isomerase n=1 Tax=Candidatus Abawacabacteria bacterium RBG_16_42_10 TaxID=1817814 RepID=A0A1F4XJ89_9BACT|nr:MAG: hypothetical protein A2V81_05360 [Candidatus Abawacabacteria bacterium RBG_16_42_10]